MVRPVYVADKVEQPIERTDGDLLGDVLPYKGVFGEQQLDEVAVCVGAVAHTCKLAEDGKEEAENGGVMRKISKMVLEATSELGSELVLRNGELLFQELNGLGQDFGAASAVLVEYGLIAWKVAAEGPRCVYDNLVSFLAADLRRFFDRQRLTEKHAEQPGQQTTSCSDCIVQPTRLVYRFVEFEFQNFEGAKNREFIVGCRAYVAYVGVRYRDDFKITHVRSFS